MTLDNFRRVDICIGKANDYIADNLFAKEGDYNGRELVVQITDGAVVVDTTGVQLIFNWKHLSEGHSGALRFEEKDVTKGIYVVAYPSQMLFEGTVACWLTIIDNGKITNTKNITLKVEKGINDELVVAENDFTILQQALIEINMYKNQIDNIKQDLINQIDVFMANKEVSLTQDINTLLSQKENLIDEQITLISTSRSNIQQTEGELADRAANLISDKTQEMDDLISLKQTELDDLHVAKGAKLDNLFTSKETKLDDLFISEKAIFDNLEANYAPQLQGVLAQFNDAMANLTIDSEVITARTSLETGKSYNNLNLRLSDIENKNIIENNNKKHIIKFEVIEGRPRIKMEEI